MHQSKMKKRTFCYGYNKRISLRMPCCWFSKSLDSNIFLKDYLIVFDCAGEYSTSAQRQL